MTERLPHQAPVVQVTPVTWGYELRSPGRDVNVTHAWQVLIETRNDAVRLGLAATKGIIDLHAAVLVQDGRAALLVGDAWAGKTSVALALVKRGWRYFSDDVAVIETSSGLVRPLPKPPGVKAQPWDAMRGYWDPEPEELGAPPGAFVIPPPFLGTMSERAIPTWIAFLEYRQGSATALTRVSPGQALARAGEHLGSLGSEELASLALITAECEAVAIRYSETEGAVEEIDGLVR